MQLSPYLSMVDSKMRIAGRGALKAEMVARLVVDDKASIKDAMEQYDLLAEQVEAAITYFMENRAALDAQEHARLTLGDQIGISVQDHLAKLRLHSRTHSHS